MTKKDWIRTGFILCVVLAFGIWITLDTNSSTKTQNEPTMSKVLEPGDPEWEEWAKARGVEMIPEVEEIINQYDHNAVMILQAMLEKLQKNGDLTDYEYVAAELSIKDLENANKPKIVKQIADILDKYPGNPPGAVLVEWLGRIGAIEGIEPILKNAVDIKKPCEEAWAKYADAKGMVSEEDFRKLPIQCQDKDWMGAYDWVDSLRKIINQTLPYHSTLESFIKGDDLEKKIRQRFLQAATKRG